LSSKGEVMIVNSNGVLINGISDVQESTVFSGSIAIFDTDGACIQIPATELDALMTKYIYLKKNKPATPDIKNSFVE
jgi:hypothetical protein